MRDQNGGRNAVHKKQLFKYTGKQAYCICKLLINEQLNNQETEGDKNEDSTLSCTSTQKYQSKPKEKSICITNDDRNGDAWLLREEKTKENIKIKLKNKIK